MKKSLGKVLQGMYFLPKSTIYLIVVFDTQNHKVLYLSFSWMTHYQLGSSGAKQH